MSQIKQTTITKPALSHLGAQFQPAPRQDDPRYTELAQKINDGIAKGEM